MRTLLITPGMVFGKLTTIAPSQKACRTVWKCTCECGNTTAVRPSSLVAGTTKSCGCLSRELVAIRFTKHGMSTTPTYRIWAGVLSRCRNKKDKRYHDYGGRGIKLTWKWLNFQNFYNDMGERPSKKHSIDRIDNDGPYCKDNCRWATSDQQCLSKRSTIWVEHEGVDIPLIIYCRERDLSYSSMRHKLRAGMSLIEATNKKTRGRD